MYKLASLNLVKLLNIPIIGLLLFLFHFAPHTYASGWTSLGPSNTAIRQVVVDPTNANTLYAVSSGVGAFKSTDGGTTWNAINNGLSDPQHHPYFDIAIDPVNPNVLYMVSRGSCCDSSILPGVFRTTDGGANWTDISPNVQSGYPAFKDIAIDPNNHNTVYIGSANHCNGIWKTTDGGNSWSQAGAPNCDLTALLVDPTNSNNVYAGESTFYKSTDAGANWTGVDPGVFNNYGAQPIAIDPSNSNIIYVATGNQGYFYKSTDAGATWTRDLAYPGGAPGEGHTMITDPTKPNTVYLANNSQPRIATSTDGGTSFTTLTVPNNGLATGFAASVNNPGLLYAATSVGVYVYNFNLPPHVNSLNGATINVGGAYSESGSFTDADSTSWTATVDYGDGGGAQTLSLNGTAFTLNHTYTTAGTFTVTVSVTDNQGTTGTGTATVAVNSPPSVNTFNGSTINEGDTYSANGSFTDPDSTSWAATVNYGDGNAGSLTLNGQNFTLSHVYKHEGTYTVTVAVTDNQGATGTKTATVIVNNAPFSVGAITAPSDPVLVNTAITASASFTDPGVLDTHTATWNWGDGNATTGTVTETNGSGSVSDSHTYTATGVYMITLTVTDDDGVSNSSTFPYVAVYDTNTSFAGGRSYDNPTSASPSTSGKVSFGISAKYSGNTLTGSAKMDFKAANLDLASTSLQSLATSNGKAYLKGSGTVNGSGSYTFLATGIDGSVVGGNDLIRFQIKDSSNNVVYDSQPGAGDTTDPTTVDATGNIRVH